MFHHPPPKPKQCIVERTLVEVPGTDSLTLFRQGMRDECRGDDEHRKWLATGVVPPSVAELCESLLNESVLDMIADRQMPLFPREEWGE